MARPASLLLGLALLASPVLAVGLTAGDVDDNLNWGQYISYASRAVVRDDGLPKIALDDRVTILVKDATGSPMPFVPVTVTDAEDTVSVQLVSGADGVVRLFPAFDGLGKSSVFRVRVGDSPPQAAARIDLAELDGARVATIAVDGRASAPEAIDLMLVVDATGSMSDEIHYLTVELSRIVADVAEAHPNADLRLGLTMYRDHGDEYVVKSFGFTSSVDTMADRISAQRADGGGDYEEAVDEALVAAVADEWRDGATARMLFLVGDAPPHADDYDRFLEGVRSARAKGIHIEPVGASGVADAAEYLFRAAAALTQGRYVFLTDDSGLGNPHAEPHVQCYLVTELSGLLVRIVGSEFTGTRIEADSGDVMRSVGSYERGVCLADEDGEPKAQPHPSVGAAGGTSTPGPGLAWLMAAVGLALLLGRGQRRHP